MPYSHAFLISQINTLLNILSFFASIMALC